MTDRFIDREDYLPLKKPEQLVHKILQNKQ